MKVVTSKYFSWWFCLSFPWRAVEEDVGVFEFFDVEVMDLFAEATVAEATVGSGGASYSGGAGADARGTIEVPTVGLGPGVMV